MAKNVPAELKRESAGVLAFHPVALAVFSVGLVLAGGLLGSGMFGRTRSNDLGQTNAASNSALAEAPKPTEIPPWGELITSDVLVERPEEYVSLETGTNQPAEWHFFRRTPQQVREMMLANGMPPAEVEHVMAQDKVSATSDGTMVRPGDEAVFALAPHTRAALYEAQPYNAVNRYIPAPFYFDGSVDAWLAGSGLGAAHIAQFKKLVYPVGRLHGFSDLEVMLRALPSDKHRLALLKAVSRQPAVLVNLRVRPDTDVDRLLGYWAPGVRVKDARPLLESLRRLPDGGTISLVHLLPPFARDRVFTFPRLSGPNEPIMDCHWSALNFFNEIPDNRFSQPGYTFWYVQNNYYTVWKPTQCGDLILVIRDRTNVLHSAIYLADDIVFTKNGNNVNQPWTLMHVKDLMAVYDRGNGTALHYYRQKNR